MFFSRACDSVLSWGSFWCVGMIIYAGEKCPVLLALCEVNQSVTVEFSLNKLLNKQSVVRWFYRNVLQPFGQYLHTFQIAALRVNMEHALPNSLEINPLLLIPKYLQKDEAKT